MKVDYQTLIICEFKLSSQSFPQICFQKAAVFEVDLVSSQLRHSGVLETIRIRGDGYPVRMPFYVFLFR